MLILLSLMNSNPGKDYCNSSYTPCVYDILYLVPTSYADSTLKYTHRRVRTYITPSIFIDTLYFVAYEEIDTTGNKDIINLHGDDILVYPDKKVCWFTPYYYVFVRKGNRTYQVEHDTLQPGLGRWFSPYDSTRDHLQLVYNNIHDTSFYIMLFRHYLGYYRNPTHRLINKYTPIVDMSYKNSYIRYYKVGITGVWAPMRTFYDPPVFDSIITSDEVSHLKASYFEIYHYIHGPYSYDGSYYNRSGYLPITLGNIDSTGDCHCVWESFRRGK